VSDPAEKKLGAELRQRFEDTVNAVLEVTGHTRLLEDNARLRRLIEMRNPYIDPINILQVLGCVCACLLWWAVEGMDGRCGRPQESARAASAARTPRAAIMVKLAGQWLTTDP